jgi:hypothetical protein
VLLGVGVIDGVGEGPMADKVAVAALVGVAVAEMSEVKASCSSLTSVAAAPAATVSAMRVDRRPVEAAVCWVAVDEAHPVKPSQTGRIKKKETANLAFNRIGAVPYQYARDEMDQ